MWPIMTTDSPGALATATGRHLTGDPGDVLSVRAFGDGDPLDPRRGHGTRQSGASTPRRAEAMVAVSAVPWSRSPPRGV
jgi:hypothetical protein